MCVCWSWLAVDYFVQHGFRLEQEPDGRRWAVRECLRVEVAAYCGHFDCPPHAAVLVRAEAA